MPVGSYAAENLEGLPFPQPNAGLESAPLVDVLFDQLEFLLAHGGLRCPEGCPECVRLEQVKGLLLLPFRAIDSQAYRPGPTG
jgi:hypothetical protein